MSPARSPEGTAASMPGDGERGTRHAGIDRDDVVETARRLVEAEGPDALTMRKLANELGVTPTTLYWHVGKREDIVAAVIERQSRLMAVREIRGDTAAERITNAAMHTWESALAHPRVTGLAHTTGASAMLQLPQEIALVRELNAAGLSGDDARDALRAILATIAGFLVLALRRPAPDAPARSSHEMWAGIEVAGVDEATRRAMTEPADLETLCRTSVAALVDRWLALPR
ncbi:MAG: TetR/AcrR family transcriptional regulator [Acidimicrobiales bacterium]